MRRVTSVRSVKQEHVDGDLGLVSQLRQYCESEPVQGRVALLACAGTFGKHLRLRCFQWKWRPDKAEPCGGHWYVTGHLKDVSEILQLCRGFELDHQVESLEVVAQQAGGQDSEKAVESWSSQPRRRGTSAGREKQKRKA